MSWWRNNDDRDDKSEEDFWGTLCLGTIILILVSIIVVSLLVSGCAEKTATKSYHIKCKDAEVEIHYNMEDEEIEIKGL